jgi:hypothetical protein
VANQNLTGVAFAASAVQTRHSRIVECLVRGNPKFAGVEPGAVAVLDMYPIVLSIGFGKLPASEPENVFMGQLTVELAEGQEGLNPPYFFKFVLEGVFQFMPRDLPSESIAEYTAIHGSAALMAMARETLAQLTARGMHGPVLLPALVFGRSPDAVKSGLVGDLVGVQKADGGTEGKP